MKLNKFKIVDRCMYWPEEKTLVIGDLHLGYENMLSEQGTSIPLRQLKETKEILERVFAKLDNEKVEKIILLGDIKHYFGGILKQEYEDFKELVKFFEEKVKNVKIIVTKGNHDKIFESFIEKNVTFVDYLVEKEILFLHGDDKSVKICYDLIKSKKIKLIVVGHFHPAYVLKEKRGIKQEKYKCFLYGYSDEYKKKVIFVPSFFPLVVGSDILTELQISNVNTMKKILIDELGNLYNFRFA